MTDIPRRAKIVCTLGPASRSREVLRRMIDAGMDVARLNFSHGTHEEHDETLALVRRLAHQAGRTVGVLQDLQGPKLRVGRIPDEPILLRRGRTFTLTTRAGVASEDAVTVSYRKLPRDVKKGDLILLDDGLLQLTVRGVTDHDVRCRVETGGPLYSHKGINLPGRNLTVPALTAKDRRDLEWGIEHGVDYVALSFVRRAKDVAAVHRVLRRRGAAIPVIAKLEKPQATENLEEILEAAEGVMVARGDLGVELPPEKVPVLQKQIIHRARMRGRPVVTATQMLESMVSNRRPTRAEASDVANAIFDGTDAVMLSAETAVGRYPVETVRMMVRVVVEAERSPLFRAGRITPESAGGDPPIPDAVALAASEAAGELGARALVVFTQSGSTARVLSKHRPRTPIVAFTPDEEVERRLALVWGVRPIRLEPPSDAEAMVAAVVERLRQGRFARKGDLVVITAGAPLAARGPTNFMLVHRV